MMIRRRCWLCWGLRSRGSRAHTDLVADLRGLGVSALGRAAPRLASALRTSPVPFVLILDDLHELRSPACHDVLSVVISGIPDGSQLVAASRSEQPHLPRLRASGDAVEIAAGDLALDVAGAEQIFAEAHVNLTHEQAAAVTARTEGWPVGLYLAAVIAKDSRGDVLTISGDDRYVADYLYRESLSQLPESVQRFLRRTAVLDQLSAPLCDAILDESGAYAQLRDLEATSLFLVPLDRRRGWYRYHALFREFLLGELQRVEPDVTAKLHLRAADWYESNGSPALALEHLLNTAERDTLRPAGGASWSCRPIRPARLVNRATLALDPRPRCHRGVSPARGPGRMVRGVDRGNRRRATVGGLPRHRLIRPGPRRRHGLVRLGAGHVARSHVCRRTRADGDRRELRRRRGTAVEPMARLGADRVRRGAAAPRRP